MYCHPLMSTKLVAKNDNSQRWHLLDAFTGDGFAIVNNGTRKFLKAVESLSAIYALQSNIDSSRFSWCFTLVVDATPTDSGLRWDVSHVNGWIRLYKSRFLHWKTCRMC